MFSSASSFSCCSWIWANECIDVSTVWPRVHTEGPHQGTFYVCVSGSQWGMNTSIMRACVSLCACVSVVNSWKNGRLTFFYVRVHTVHGLTLKQTHTCTYIHTLMGWQSALAELRWTNGNLGKEECVWRSSKRGRQNPQQATPVVLVSASVSVWWCVCLHKKAGRVGNCVTIWVCVLHYNFTDSWQWIVWMYVTKPSI